MFNKFNLVLASIYCCLLLYSYDSLAMKFMKDAQGELLDHKREYKEIREQIAAMANEENGPAQENSERDKNLAQACMDYISEDYPKDAYVFYHLGRAKFRLGEYYSALKYFGLALQHADNQSINTYEPTVMIAFTYRQIRRLPQPVYVQSYSFQQLSNLINSALTQRINDEIKIIQNWETINGNEINYILEEYTKKAVNYNLAARLRVFLANSSTYQSALFLLNQYLQIQNCIQRILGMMELKLGLDDPNFGVQILAGSWTGPPA